MSRPKTIYLAGPMTGLTTTQAQEWRERAKKLLVFESRDEPPRRTLSPVRDMPEQKLCGFANQPRIDFARDVLDIRAADVVLANFEGAERVSLGTVWELGFAHALGKTIVVVGPGAAHDHLFVRQSASGVFETLEEACRWIRSLP